LGGGTIEGRETERKDLLRRDLAAEKKKKKKKITWSRKRKGGGCRRKRGETLLMLQRGYEKNLNQRGAEGNSQESL